MHARPALRPNWYLLVTVATWGLNFVALKEMYKEVSAPALALIRFLVMWVSLVLVCLWRKESLKYPREDALKLLYLGFISMGVYMLLFLEGMRGSAATEGAILLQTAPVFTVLLAAAFRQERFSIGAVIGAIVAFSGTVLILYSPTSHHEVKILSNGLVILSALVWAYCVVVMRPLLVKYSPLRVLTLSMAGGLPVMLLYGLAPVLHQDWGAVSGYGWVMFFHISILSGVVAFLCFYQGVRQVGSTGATLYQFMVPTAAMLFSLLIEGTKPTVFQLAGLVVVLAGVGYASRARYLAQMSAPSAG